MPFSGLSANSGPTFHATKMAISTTTIVTIVFGICAVAGTIFTAWQGHIALKARRRNGLGARAASDDIELQSQNERGPQNPHSIALHPPPEATASESDLATGPIPLQEPPGSPPSRPASTPLPPGGPANRYPLPDTSGA